MAWNQFPFLFGGQCHPGFGAPTQDETLQSGEGKPLFRKQTKWMAFSVKTKPIPAFVSYTGMGKCNMQGFGSSLNEQGCSPATWPPSHRNRD